MIYDQENKYIRDYMRKRRGKSYLIKLETEAIKRGYTVKELIKLLLIIITDDDLVKAILDD